MGKNYIDALLAMGKYMACQLNSGKRAQVVSCLVEGNSIRATVRMTGVAKNTVVKLLCDLRRTR